MNGREQNTIHVFSPDGKDVAYKKLVMTNDDYPVNMSKHVRDPKTYKKDGRYYMIQGGRDAESYGCALFVLFRRSGTLEMVRYGADSKSHLVICGNARICSRLTASRL